MTVNASDPCVNDHRYGGRRIVSAASQIAMMTKAAPAEGHAGCLEGLSFRRPVEVHERVQLTLRVVGDELRLSEGKDEVARSRLATAASMQPARPPGRMAGNVTDVTEGFRSWLDDECPMEYGPFYDVVSRLEEVESPSGRYAVAHVDGGPTMPAGRRFPEAYIDAGFQVLAFVGGEGSGGLPWRIERVVHYPGARPPAKVVVWPAVIDGSGVVRGDVSIETAQGETLLVMEGVTLRAPGAGTARTRAGVGSRDAERVQVRRWVPLPSTLGTEPLQTDDVPVLRPKVTASVAADVCAFAEELVGTLSRKPRAVRVLTCRGRAVKDGVRIDPFAAAVGALLGPARLEYPGTLIQWLDADNEEPLLSVPLPAESVEAAWCDGRWNAPVYEDAPASRAQPDVAGRWLVIGGRSALVGALLPVLPGLGIGCLTLLSRGLPGPEERARIREMLQGARVEFIQADVTSSDFAIPENDGPYDVIMNAAGLLDDRLLRRVCPQQVLAVISPKAAGADALTVYSKENPATKVIVMSSTAAERGQLGQGVYAAANAYQDAIAQNNRCESRPWFTLRWGLWEVGMGERIHAQAAAVGYPVITPEQGRRLLHEALGLGPGEYWLDGSTYSTHSGPPARGAEQEATTAYPSGGTGMTTPTTSRDCVITVCEALAAVLERASVSPQDSPEDLGLDSMMAVETSAYLADRGLDLDAAEAFGHATVADLAARVRVRDTVASPSGPTASRARMAAWTPEPGPSSSPEGGWSAALAAPPEVVGSLTAPPEVVGSLTAPPEVVGSLTAPPEVAGSLATGPAHLGKRSDADPYGGAPRRTLPSTLLPLTGDHPLRTRINEISADDRGLVARGEYFYEPVVEDNRGAYVKIDGEWKINFASYSYLGLIGNEFINQRAISEVQRSGTAAHGVRLLAGTGVVHRQLEGRIASFLGREDAVAFSSGYMANVATIAALVTTGDVVLGDTLNHASIVDGCRLSGAEFRSYAHNDANALRRELERSVGRRTLVVADAVFSMDGDILNLTSIAEACREFNAILMVDEAHSLGVLGSTGRGITEYYGVDPATIDVSMGTLSKTIPSAGGYVAGGRDLIFALKNEARGWMFSAALPPAQAAAADAAIELLTLAPELPQRLKQRADLYRTLLSDAGLSTMNSVTPVVPVRCGTADQAIQMAQLCQRNGLFVQPITYPTVPKATPRLRTIVNLNHTEKDLRTGADLIVSAARNVGLI